MQVSIKKHQTHISENQRSIWPLVQKEKIGYAVRQTLLFQTGPREKERQGPNSPSVFPEPPREGQLRTASQMPFALIVQR